MKQRRKEGFCYIIIPRWWWSSSHPPQQQLQQLDLTWGMTSEPRIYKKKKKKSGKQAGRQPTNQNRFSARESTGRIPDRQPQQQQQHQDLKNHFHQWLDLDPRENLLVDAFILNSSDDDDDEGFTKSAKAEARRMPTIKFMGMVGLFPFFAKRRAALLWRHIRVYLGYYLQNLITLHSKTTKWYYETHVLEERSREKLTSASWSSLLLALAWQWVIHIVRLV